MLERSQSEREKLDCQLNKHYKNFISTSEFSKTLKDNSMFFEKCKHRICVSGGPDSTALMMLMNEWAIKNKCFLTILHFNHNLRKFLRRVRFYPKNLEKIKFRMLSF